jgi:hypothetical protein
MLITFGWLAGLALLVYIVFFSVLRKDDPAPAERYIDYGVYFLLGLWLASIVLLEYFLR